MLDSEGFVTEGSTGNIFIVKNKRIITTPKGTILLGITRDTIIEIAKQKGFTIEEKHFTTDDIYSSDEAFFCGTAVEITTIRSLDDWVIGDGTIGPITKKIKQYYHDIVRGKYPEFDAALTYANNHRKVAA